MKRNFLFAVLMTVIVIFSAIDARSQVLWKVTSPDGAVTSHILGTHHFAPVGFLDSISGLDEALKNSDILYGELVMADMMKPEGIQQMQQLMMAPADSTLDKVLSPAQWEKLETVWNEYGDSRIPLKMLSALKPAAFSTQLTACMTMKALPDNNLNVGIDQTMQQRADSLGIQVAGLETVGFQANMLFGLPISVQAAELMEVADDAEGNLKKVIDLTDAYLAKDFNTLTKIIDEEAKKNPEGNERLIFSRNDAWMEQLVPEMRNRRVMVVVGAGHLVGQRGLLEALRSQGFKVSCK